MKTKLRRQVKGQRHKTVLYKKRHQHERKKYFNKTNTVYNCKLMFKKKK